MHQINEHNQPSAYLGLLETVLNQETELVKKQEALIADKKDNIKTLLQIMDKIKSPELISHDIQQIARQNPANNKRKSMWIVQLAQSYAEQIIESKTTKLTAQNENELNVTAEAAPSTPVFEHRNDLGHSNKRSSKKRKRFIGLFF